MILSYISETYAMSEDYESAKKYAAEEGFNGISLLYRVKKYIYHYEI